MWTFLIIMSVWTLILAFFSLKMATAALMTSVVLLLIFAFNEGARGWAARLDNRFNDEELIDKVMQRINGDTAESQ